MGALLDRCLGGLRFLVPFACRVGHDEEWDFHSHTRESFCTAKRTCRSKVRCIIMCSSLWARSVNVSLPVDGMRA